LAEERITFRSGALSIEGLLKRCEGSKGVVVTHPHPLYGGDMYNNVVFTLLHAYRNMGYTTLRFNFRGVGGSDGRYEEGCGEQDDVKAALDYLAGLGCTCTDLAGYSFGAWVNAMGLDRYSEVKHLCVVSPPVAFLDFSGLEYSPRIGLVVSGSRDEIAPPSMIREMMGKWNPDAEFRVIEGADHFYQGYERDLDKVITGFLGGKAEKLEG